MIVSRDLSFAVAAIAAYLALIGAALLNTTLMGVAGIVAAVAALVCGLLVALIEDADADTEVVAPEHDIDDETELPYRPAEHRPTWDAATWGAPE